MGRPLEFDIAKATDIASKLFWAKGYDGTSVRDLTDAMRIASPSFYNTFGSKEALFRTVIGNYYALHYQRFQEAFQRPTMRAAAEELLLGYANMVTASPHAPGCLIMNSALPCAQGDPLRDWLAESRKDLRTNLCERFVEAKAQRKLPDRADPALLARVIVVLAWGIAVEAQGGATRSDLRSTIVLALSSLPLDIQD